MKSPLPSTKDICLLLITSLARILVSGRTCYALLMGVVCRVRHSHGGTCRDEVIASEIHYNIDNTTNPIHLRLSKIKHPLGSGTVLHPTNESQRQPKYHE